jgi:hypothetical protein
MLRSITTTISGLAVLASLGAASASLTAAQAKVNVGGTEQFTYSGARLPSGSVGYLQHLAGKTWKPSLTLGGRTHGTAAVKLAAVGTASFRVLFTHGSRIVVASKPVVVTVLPSLGASLRGVSTRISTGQSAKFTYTVANLASGDAAQLQRQFGSAGAWKAVAALAARSNAAITAPALGTLGKYAYRVAIVRAGHTLKNSPSVTVYAYANVSLVPDCGYVSCGGSLQVGNNIFSYSDFANAGLYPQY